MAEGLLTGKRILIVEDEYLIASDLKRTVLKQGGVPIGPTGDLTAGLSLAEVEKIDAALLDVNLESASSYPIADMLTARSVPYAFLTGYDGWALPERYRAVLRIAKPFMIQDVVQSLIQLVQPDAVSITQLSGQLSQI